MARTNADEVRAIIPQSPSLAGNDLTPFIDSASGLVDEVEARDTSATLSEDRLRLIELWLAAHFYAIFDKQLESEGASNAVGRYMGKTAMYLDSTLWGQQAKLLDTTGALAQIDAAVQKPDPGQVEMEWLGTDYCEPLV